MVLLEKNSFFYPSKTLSECAFSLNLEVLHRKQKRWHNFLSNFFWSIDRKFDVKKTNDPKFDIKFVINFFFHLLVGFPFIFTCRYDTTSFWTSGTVDLGSNYHPFQGDYKGAAVTITATVAPALVPMHWRRERQQRTRQKGSSWRYMPFSSSMRWSSELIRDRSEASSLSSQAKAAPVISYWAESYRHVCVRAWP